MVDFALVSALVTVLFLGVVQVTLYQHVRSTLVDSAAEGARTAGQADRSLEDGVTRARALIEGSLSSAYAQDVRAELVDRDGLDLVRITVTAPMPLVGLLGPGSSIQVQGHGLREQP